MPKDVPDFATFAAELNYDAIPAPVLTVLRRSFTDAMGVAAVGATTPMARIARDTALALFGAGTAGGSRILMDGRRLSPVGAAMAGGFTLDSIDAHDGSSPCKGHAGSAVFPALIALAQAEAGQGRALDGRRFAEVLTLAYEISYRAGLAQHATCADYHASGSWTCVGVAASGAAMLRGSVEQIRHAAGIGEYHGPRSQMMRCIDFPTNVRDGVGWGAPSGVTAAYLAKAGFTGAPALTCESAQSAEFWADLGSGWRVVEDTHYKAYPCCRWAHPSMDAAVELMAQHNLHHEQIKAVEIRTFHNATRLAGHAPQTPDEFAYSIAFPVATMLVRGQLGVAELAPDTLKDKEILRISKATHLIDDPHYSRISVGVRWADVTLVLKDGRRLQSAPKTPRGDVDAPLNDAEISTKFHLFADPVIATARADEIETLSGNFDDLDHTEFARLLDLCTSSRVEN